MFHKEHKDILEAMRVVAEVLTFVAYGFLLGAMFSKLLASDFIPAFYSFGMLVFLVFWWLTQ